MLQFTTLTPNPNNKLSMLKSQENGKLRAQSQRPASRKCD